MTLDERARSAADGIRSSVSQADLRLPVPGAAPGPMPFVARMVSFAMAVVAVSIIGLLAIGFRGAGVVESEPTISSPSTFAEPQVLPPREPATPPTTAADASVPPVTTPPPTTTPQDVTPPHLEIEHPIDGSVFTESALRFSGTTEPGATVMAGRYEADVADDGRWSIVLFLAEGPNRATITATDAAGNVAEASVVVTYRPPVDEPPAEPPKDEPPPKDDPPPEEEAYDFTAHQVFGSCSESPPYDEFYGTAAPGTRIVVWGGNGEGAVIADQAGNWALRVVFPEAPYGETIVVTVKNTETGQTKQFEFVSYAGG